MSKRGGKWRADYQPPGQPARERRQRERKRGGSTRQVVVLEDGSLGYCMLRSDECTTAAVATALQVPIEQVPDLRLDERVAAGEDPEEVNRGAWARLAEWLDGRGLELVYHETPPVDHERWIGVTAPAGPESSEWALQYTLDQARERGLGDDKLRELELDLRRLAAAPFSAHCLVMARDRILHDVAVAVKSPPGMRLRSWGLADISYGITFNAKE